MRRLGFGPCQIRLRLRRGGGDAHSSFGNSDFDSWMIDLDLVVKI